VDATTWELAQVQRERNIRKAKRNAKHNYLLSGLIRCGCGRAMVGITPNKIKLYRYYHCNSMVGLAGVVECSCFERYMPAEVLEAAVWDHILMVIKYPEEFERKLREAQKTELDAFDPQREELATVKEMLTDAEAKAVSIVAALEKARGIVEKTLQEKIDELNARYEALDARRLVLEDILARRRLTDEVILAAVRYAEDIAKGIDNANSKTKREILDVFDAKVTVKDGIATLSYSLPTPVSIELHLSLCALN